MNIVSLPILIPLLAGALSLLFWRMPMTQRYLSIVSSALILFVAIDMFMQVNASGYLVLHTASWAAPFGVTLVADSLSAVMVLLNAIIGLAICIYSLAGTPSAHIRFGYYPLIHWLLAGVSGSFLTGDLFNLFVWFEVMLLASFALMTLGGRKSQMEGAIKYVALNLFSSALFLSSVGLLYGVMGTLNMADLALKVAHAPETGLLTVISVLLMVSFSIKAAAFPLYFWLPASYHTPLIAISALFAGLLTKVGVYALMRVFSLIFTQDVGYTHTILLWMGVATMFFGVLGAASQFDFRRILSFHIISQIGYMIIGLALFTPLAIAGAVFYIIHHIIVKTNLFLVSGIVYRLLGSYQLKSLGGLYRYRPYLALLFFIPAFSLAGIPPLSGFFAKFVVIKAALDSQAYVVTFIALFVGALTLYSMIKIWAMAFWAKQPPECDEITARRQNFSAESYQSTHGIHAAMTPSFWLMYLPVIGLASLTVLIGIYAEPVLTFSMHVADQLLHPDGYITAVLGTDYIEAFKATQATVTDAAVTGEAP